MWMWINLLKSAACDVSRIYWNHWRSVGALARSYRHICSQPASAPLTPPLIPPTIQPKYEMLVLLVCCLQCGPFCSTKLSSLNLHSREGKQSFYLFILLLKEENRHWEHLATVEATHCKMPAGYTVVIDWLTRAEWFLSPRGAKHPRQALLRRRAENTHARARGRKEATKKDKQDLHSMAF